MLGEANAKGFVRVLILLDDTVTLERMDDERNSLPAVMEEKAQKVLSELGQNTLPSGHWNNGIGQMGAYVNESGLHILAASDQAISFVRDITHPYRIKAADADGSLDAVEKAIIADGFANVEIFLNVDSIDYDIDRSGKTVLSPSAAITAQAQTIKSAILNENHANGIKNLEDDFSARPVMRANIDRTAFHALIERDDIRAIRPTNYADPRVAQWPEEVLEAAKEFGEAEVMITLRGGDLFTPKTGYLSETAIKSQVAANRRALKDIIAQTGALDPDEESLSGANLGVLHSRLPFEALAKLYDSKDERILSVELNKPVAETSLTNSTNLMNLPQAWNKGYRAAGQNIVIVDTGVRKNHAFFTTGSTTRVTYEACFGTNGVGPGGVVYSSICPSANSLGDSPLGLAGSGAPNSNLTVCNSAPNHDCSHGTHVAGIAAGRQNPVLSPSNLQGVAPDASIISVQVFSYSTNPPKGSAFTSDIQAALGAIDQNTAGTSSPNTVNLSISSPSLYSSSSNCPTFYNSQVSNLNSKGIPVIASTGNNSNKGAISSPACTPLVIKVSSVKNDSTGTTLSNFANIISQSVFSGPILLAPGGEDGGTGIVSAHYANTIATVPISGTSMAAPHVAGFYAAIKAATPGTSVANATAWIVTTGSIPVTINLPGVGNQTFRRVRAPNF
ncbi:S8 family serine peptidase [Nitrosomonas sp. sh817]|uniref:S8 family serine peptidase n=1 Tax=Nitrosomonas sp. sh817 TaxID=3070658 RepID=UPI0027DCE14E|nr:S8 family serine peptidase [Nitrosomonas sp. sh817]WMJ08620.1 S8 family serine peptidase [Nitrosomonas sp. sh817]